MDFGRFKDTMLYQVFDYYFSRWKNLNLYSAIMVAAPILVVAIICMIVAVIVDFLCALYTVIFD